MEADSVLLRVMLALLHFLVGYGIGCFPGRKKRGPIRLWPRFAAFARMKLGRRQPRSKN